MDWTILEKVGLGGALLALIYFGYQIVMFLLQQWKASTEALNRNSEAFERAHQREVEFQEKMINISEDTNKKVTELHSKQLGGN